METTSTRFGVEIILINPTTDITVDIGL